MSVHDSYRSPLESRYASPQMRAIFSAQRKFTTWRRLWLALAEAEHELGLQQVTTEALQQLRAHLDDIDYDAAARYEREMRHDVMAHVRALGDIAPAARGVIHLGATSQFVNCNTELLQMSDALDLIARGIARVIDGLGRFAAEHRDLATLGFTHYQPAQPTTVGKRACLWAYDFALALEDIEHRRRALRLRGAKGATGTQASFLQLFDGDAARVERLDELVCEKMGVEPDRRYAVTGQTYPRLVDAQVINAVAVVAAAAHKCCTDVRLLAGRGELEEPFESGQVGSSAMAYKRNPMRCERACGLARFVMALAQNPLSTAAVQWLERTLDDSANRRLVLPEAFLALDSVLLLVGDVARGLVARPAAIRAALDAELPFLATERLLMAAARRGVDRQEAHEAIRQASMAARDEPSRGARLIELLRGETMFAGIDINALLDPAGFVGRAPEQVDRFIAEIVEPVRGRYAEHLAPAAGVEV